MCSNNSVVNLKGKFCYYLALLILIKSDVSATIWQLLKLNAAGNHHHQQRFRFISKSRLIESQTIIAFQLILSLITLPLFQDNYSFGESNYR